MKIRFYYLDHLRACMTILVLLHHTAITYGAEGSWYVVENAGKELTPTKALLSLFTGVNQAFFMGLFFLLAGYFTPGAYDRKGAGKFLRDRLVRLGIPLFVYVFGIGPALVYAIEAWPERSFSDFYADNVLTLRLVNWGPLWFVEALLYMAVGYVLFRKLADRNGVKFHSSAASRETAASSAECALPSKRVVLLSALAVGLAAFLLRLVFPTGEDVLGLQLGYFASYLFLFALGIAAYRRGWLERLDAKTASFWFRISLAAIPVLPAAVLWNDATGGGADLAGGFSWLAFVYAMWEPFVAFGIIMKLVVVFRERWNETNRVWNMLSDNAYVVYIIHPPVLVFVTTLFRSIALPVPLKFVIVGALGTALCFALGALIRKLPYADRVL